MSSLDRLPKALSARWEAQPFEMREATVEVPWLSLDGVMAPMRGYREAGCATVSLVDRDGEPAQRAHGPESRREDDWPPRSSANLTVSSSRWGQLVPRCPRGRAHRLLPRRRASQRRLRHRPRDRLPQGRGAFKKIAICCAMSLMGCHPGVVRSLRATSESQVLGYFRNRHRMGYADAKARDCPSAPASWRRRATASPNGSNAPACDGGRRAALARPNAWSLLAQSYRTPVSLTMWCPFAVQTFTSNDQSRTITDRS